MAVKLEKCIDFMANIIIEGALKTGFKLMWTSAEIESADMPEESEVSARAYAWRPKGKDAELERVIFVVKDTRARHYAYAAMEPNGETACIDEIEKFKKEYGKK